MSLKPLKMLENRVWRIYLGGYLLDELRGDTAKDGYFPEDWLASVVPANNPPRDNKPENEGLSSILNENGDTVFLKDLIEKNPLEMLGEEHISKFGTNFGVLTKFLDSAERLPIQVHPDKPTAKRLFSSDYGKTESWYILAGREIDGEAPYILLGFKEDIDTAKLRELFDKQDITAIASLMHKITVKPGEVYMISGGTPHAIGSGCFILEIQEPTDYTISLEKKDMLGNDVPDSLIHQGIGFEKMFECFHYDKCTEAELLSNFRLEPVHIDGGNYKLIGYNDTPCYALNRITVSGVYTKQPANKPSALVVVQGCGEIDGIKVSQGDCLFIPYALGCFDIHSDADMILLECLPPQ